MLIYKHSAGGSCPLAKGGLDFPRVSSVCGQVRAPIDIPRGFFLDVVVENATYSLEVAEDVRTCRVGFIDMSAGKRFRCPVTAVSVCAWMWMCVLSFARPSALLSDSQGPGV